MALIRARYSQIYDTDYKQSVRVATTGSVGNLLVAGGAPSIVDDKTLAVNNRILVKNQLDATQNGIYRVVTVGTGSDGTWIRTLDADADDKVTSGMSTTVSEGTENASKTFKLTTLDPIVLGTSELVFVNPFIGGGGTGDSLINGSKSVVLESTGNLTLPASGAVFNNVAVLTTTTSDQVIDSFAITSYHTAKYLIQAVCSAGIHSTEFIVIHNGTTAYHTEYASMFTDSSLFTVNAAIVSSNVNVTVTPTNIDTTFDVIRTSLAARSTISSLEGDFMSLTGTEDLLSGSGVVDLMS